MNLLTKESKSSTKTMDRLTSASPSIIRLLILLSQRTWHMKIRNESFVNGRLGKSSLSSTSLRNVSRDLIIISRSSKTTNRGFTISANWQSKDMTETKLWKKRRSWWMKTAHSYCSWMARVTFTVPAQDSYMKFSSLTPVKIFLPTKELIFVMKSRWKCDNCLVAPSYQR